MFFLTPVIHLSGVLFASAGEGGLALFAVIVLSGLFGYLPTLGVHLLVNTICQGVGRLWINLLVATAANIACVGALMWRMKGGPSDATQMLIGVAISGQVALSLLAVIQARSEPATVEATSQSSGDREPQRAHDDYSSL